MLALTSPYLLISHITKNIPKFTNDHKKRLHGLASILKVILAPSPDPAPALLMVQIMNDSY
jgi:hypothetical protein